MRVLSRCLLRGAAALVVVSGCACLWAGPARAYCREVTAAPPQDYDPVTAGCFTTNPDGGGQLPLLFWANQCVGFNMQRDASQYVSLADATNIAIEAFAKWAGAKCPGGGSPSITATNLTPVSCGQAPSQSHNNPIIFRDTMWPHGDRSNAIGYTTLTVNLETGEILGAAIEINSADHVIVTSGPAMNGAYDLASILTHETGHFLGLAHSADPNAVMYAYYRPGTVELTPDDIAGICSIYPSDGSRNTEKGPVASTACNPLPVGGLLDECGSLDAGTAASTVTLSTPAGDGGTGPAAGAAMCPTSPFNCMLYGGAASGASARALPGCGLFALGLLVRRRLRSRRVLAHATIW